MNTEELLKPRYKVIADYPNSPYTVGDVYKFKKKLRNSFYEKENGFSPANLYAPDQYPHLFRKLEWWEERNETDLPQYVKHGQNGKPRKVVRIYRENIIEFEGGRTRRLNEKYLPSTLEEYTNYSGIKNAPI